MGNLLEIIKKLHDFMDLSKSSVTESIEDRLYKQKDGRVSPLRLKDSKPKPVTLQTIEHKTIAKPLHGRGLPTGAREGNRTIADPHKGA